MKFMKYVFRGVCFSLAMNGACVFAVDEWKAVCETDFPPYNYIKDGNKIGMDTEISELVLKKLGVKYEIKDYPWPRVLATLEAGDADLAWQFTDSPERREKFWLVGPIRDGVTVFVVPKDSPIKDWSTLDDFKGKKVGVVKEFKYTPEFDSYTGFSERDEAINNEQLIKKLADKRDDFAIGDLGSLTYQAKVTGNSDKVRFLAKSIKSIARYIGFNKKQEEKSKEFAKALEEVKNTPEYKAIIEKYTSK